MGHLNENNGMFPNSVNVRFWHKADIRKSLLLDIIPLFVVGGKMKFPLISLAFILVVFFVSSGANATEPSINYKEP